MQKIKEAYELNKYIEDNFPLPDYMVTALEEYVKRGTPLCSFLKALVSNDLIKAYSYADDYTTIAMRQYVKYIYSKMPLKSIGSEENYLSWIKAFSCEEKAPQKEVLK